MINPEWEKLSCQECVKEHPILKTYVPEFAEDIIKNICNHKEK